MTIRKFLLLLPLFFLFAGCLPAAAGRTPYPTFTPLSRFQILGLDSPAPPTPTTTTTTTPVPTSNAGATASPPPGPSATPTAPPDTATPEPVSDPLITLVFTGQIVPARCVQAETDRLGQADYIYADVADIIRSADLAVGALNAALTDFPPMTGCVETFVLVGSPIQADAMAAAGFDIMSVATNHIKNCGLTSCGDIAFLDTLENLVRSDIIPVGGGANLAEALRPVVVEVAGIRFGFVSLGQIEPLAFAGENSPGIAILNEENLQNAIASVRDQADVVIVLPHWGPEYTHYPNASQLSLARTAVDAGADLIVGNHTHYIQAFVNYGNVPVYFGLGNFVFDQTQEPMRQQSLILRITFRGTQIVSTELIPVVNDQTGRVRIADQNEVVEILGGINQVNADVQADIP